MVRYFHEAESISMTAGDSIPDVLTAVAQRYIGKNPRQPYIFRAFHRGGFIRMKDYRYDLNLAEKAASARPGQYVYIWGKLWSARDVSLTFSISCLSPAVVYINGEEAFVSGLPEELFPERRTNFAAAVKHGWNDVVLRFEKTVAGCGGTFGTGSFKNFPLHFITASFERDGQEGLLYSEPVDAPLAELPQIGMAEAKTGLKWYPRREWNEEENKLGRWGRIFGLQKGASALSWSKLNIIRPDNEAVVLQGVHSGAAAIYVDGAQVYEARSGGAFKLPLYLDFGKHDVMVKAECPEDAEIWDVAVELAPQESRALWSAPRPVAGHSSHWFYAGPFSGDCPEPEEAGVMERIFPDGRGGTYWRLDTPDTWVRPYLESAQFGKWNYPLGVTLYGLLRTGQALGRDDYIRYVVEHIETAARFDEYALWDRGQYGAAGINTQLSAIDSLDDCGSFGATMLAAMESVPIRGGAATASRIAEYMRDTQERLPDGAFFRRRGSGEMRQETMWCDDLYMSTPFLVRYAELSGDPAYLDDAVRQFFLFKKYLYLPERRIMSHVYDFIRGSATCIPWGRGNGWVLFSLTEVLSRLPEDHPQKEKLLAFYRELCSGYLALQGRNGLWHQVLDRPDSYEETSCTSMFVYAFARGIRQGWLEDEEDYILAVRRGWEGLTRVSIDSKGNIYGVCRGSGYSFSPLYYKDQLGWILNDTHGTGIVMLAGVEVFLMAAELADKGQSNTSAPVARH